MPAVDEQLKEDGEDFEDLSSMLEHLGLLEYNSKFDDEKIDIESFVRKTAVSTSIFLISISAAASVLSFCLTCQLLCTIEDLKEMGIPLGPRKKITKFVKDRMNKQVHVCL